MSKPTVAQLLDAAVAAVPGGEIRPGQQAMATAIAESMESGTHLMVQAGTGTGKSLAYLAPALLSPRPVVISTATLALQSQLIATDLPRLSEAVEPVLGRKPRYAVFKGRHHYLCAAKIGADATDEEDTLFSDTEESGWVGQRSRLGKDIGRLTDWANDTDTGDRDDLDPGVSDAAWRQMSTSARDCVGAANCRWGGECFAEAARNRAREADIIITNHALLSIDIMHNRTVLPEHDLLIVDEAHELADRTTSAARAELSANSVDRLGRRASGVCGKEIAAQLTEIADQLGVVITECPNTRLEELPTALTEVLTLLDGACGTAIGEIGNVKPDSPEYMSRTQLKSWLTEARETAQRCLAGGRQDVRWCEGDGRGRSLIVAPLSVAGLLGEELFAERTVIATSATLTLGGSFDTAATSLGLKKENEVTEADKPSGTNTGPMWRSMDVGSPFEYRKQGILYVAAHLPRPTASGLSDAAADELIRLVTALDGRALGLFSSKRAATTAAEVLREKTDLPILLQGDETLPLLVKKFKADARACLLGVMSLWQGVDVPGDACQLVIVDRLPFPRPDEPLSAARSAAADEAGGSGFASVSVPHAAIRLAQGVGRLIRTGGDRGVAAVLDPRLHTARSYGPYLRKSLPPLWYTTDSDKVQGALRRLAATPADLR
ncbi:ATP-dependent DNA helicase [Stackebrandtia nassauensis]|uniref:Helicase c2 n=1 Tax=Stackebrandtia nassauensis (strain DSM 44728 / CIP 108903 / NRRL B-16338 / NBRC 102104 / LLR-40K-21) TaxID=446470 RepID=D3Q2Y8_STANL|nr:ATP-dependent DNA helicase [Stackebrandtia nassauensis]ADD39958.1 helicase c2 [Stackebrandtia nassauensis DSM 44728]